MIAVSAHASHGSGKMQTLSCYGWTSGMNKHLWPLFNHHTATVLGSLTVRTVGGPPLLALLALAVAALAACELHYTVATVTCTGTLASLQQKRMAETFDPCMMYRLHACKLASLFASTQSPRPHRASPNELLQMTHKLCQGNMMMMMMMMISYARGALYYPGTSQ
jgi:hypothetical protein